MNNVFLWPTAVSACDDGEDLPLGKIDNCFSVIMPRVPSVGEKFIIEMDNGRHRTEVDFTVYEVTTTWAPEIVSGDGDFFNSVSIRAQWPYERIKDWRFPGEAE